MKQRSISTRSVLRSRFLAAALFLGAGVAGGVRAELRYPALGNIRLEEGTIEMWLTPQFDPEATPAQATFIRRLISLNQDDDNNFVLLWRARILEHEGRVGHEAAGLYPSGRVGGERFANFPSIWALIGPGRENPGRPWAEGEAMHVAFSWNGERMRWILNGEVAAEGPFLLPLNFGVNEEMELVIGHPGGSGFLFRDLRISSIAREPEDTGFHHPDGVPADFHTLLLDRLDGQAPGQPPRESRPEVITEGLDGSRAGRSRSSLRFLSLPRGRGVDL